MPQRGDSLRAARDARFDGWFRHRTWRVRTDLTERRESDEGVVVYDHGEFWVEPPGVFKTPLGHRGRHGFLLREIGPDGQDKNPPVDAAFGHTTLMAANEQYGSVRDLPAAPRSGPPEPTG